VSYKRAFERLEPDDGKLSRPVLRGLEGSNALRLPGVMNNPVRYVDPSGYKICDEEDGQCGQTHNDVIGNIKDLIFTTFGITMSDDGGRKWDFINLQRIYIALLGMNQNYLNGMIKKVVGGSTFKLASNSLAGRYYGETDTEGITFYTNTTIPNQNLYHEFGHLINFAVHDGIVNQMKTPHYTVDGSNTYVFGGNVGDIPTSAVKNITLHDLNWPNGVDAFQHPDSDPGEQWADMFANYVAGNIASSSTGFVMRIWTITYLYSYFGLP
jgi:hypothetical protein